MQTSHTQFGQVTGSDLAVAMSAGDTGVAPLSQPELDELTACEKIIRRGLDTFIETGVALQTIRDRQLYRQGYGTFEEYCRVRWDMTTRRARQIMSGMRVVENLTEGTSVQPPETAILPTNERQTRPMMGLQPGEQKEIWEKAKSLAGEGNVPTGTQVEEAKRSGTEANEENKGGMDERLLEAWSYLRPANEDINVQCLFNRQTAGWSWKQCGEIFDELVDLGRIKNGRLVPWGLMNKVYKPYLFEEQQPTPKAAQPAKAGTPNESATITVKRKGEALASLRWMTVQLGQVRKDTEQLGHLKGQAIYHLDHAVQMIECVREQFVRAEAREVEQEKTEGTKAGIGTCHTCRTEPCPTPKIKTKHPEQGCTKWSKRRVVASKKKRKRSDAETSHSRRFARFKSAKP